MYRLLMIFVELCFLCCWAIPNLKTIAEKEMQDPLRKIPKLSDEEKKNPVNEFLYFWQKHCARWEKCAFDVAIEEVDHVGKGKRTITSAIIKFFIHKDGRCWSRIDCSNDQGKATESLMAVDSTFYCLNHASKSITQVKLSGNVTKNDMFDFAQFLFPALPFFVLDRNDVHKRFAMTLVQQDEHYTWIRFVPQLQSTLRNYNVAQVGLINYANTLSPKGFPMKIMWRDVSGKEITWDFKQVQINQDDCVAESDFKVDLEQLKKNGWTCSTANDAIFRWLFSSAIPTPA